MKKQRLDNTPHNGPDMDDVLEPNESMKETPQDKSPAQAAPHQAVSGPAPMIELDITVDSSGPVKPLGPRRLARLQREMEEHSREIAEAEQLNQGEVDEELRLKQQRFAELAQRAAAASEQDKQDAQAVAAAAHQDVLALESDDSAGGETETISVIFPESIPSVDGLSSDESLSDPGQASSASIPGRPNEVHIYTGFIPVIDDAPGKDESSQPETRSGSSADSKGDGEASPLELESAKAQDAQTANDAPAAPVRALDAEGLELLNPEDYKQRTGVPVSLVVLLSLALVALIVVMIMFVL